MPSHRPLTVAVVGATGVVGRTMIQVLLEREFPVGELRLLASGRSVGRQVEVGGELLTVAEATPAAFDGVDIALFSAGADISRELAPKAAERGAVVIDNSNAWRMEPGIPLVVSQVNPADAATHEGIVANPNCSTMQLVPLLMALRDTVAVYPHQIAFNALPEIDVFLENGYSREEWKVVTESRKILHLPDLRISCTAVRVPVFYAHSEAVHAETRAAITPERARELFAAVPGVVVRDDPEAHVYPLATEAAGSDEIYVGRIRRDPSVAHGIAFWVVSDNVRKGAATNAVEIAELLVANGWLQPASRRRTATGAAEPVAETA
jgi:aspartate-semialdehyde dehydrogenase